MMQKPLVVGMTGASGAVYAQRLLEVLMQSGREVHLSISPAAKQVLQQELHIDVDLDDFDAAPLLNLDKGNGTLHYNHYQDLMAPIASGSHVTEAMVICPCSGGTLSSVANAASGNLIQRAADIHLKERRKLVLVPRETPLSLPQLENMKRCCQAGAVILPAMPGWYHQVESIMDLVDFVVARILDQLGVDHELMQRWGNVPTLDE